MGTAVEQVFSVGYEVLNRIKSTQAEQLEEAGRLIADAHRAGHKFFVSGSGHSHTLAEEFYGRAGGLAFTVPVMTSELTLEEHPTKSAYIERLSGYAAILAELYHFQKDDVVLIASNSGRNAYPVELALCAKERGCKVIAVTSVAHSTEVTSRHASGKKLMDVADVVIDNCGVPGDSALEVEGMRAKMCPTSSMANAFIVQSISVACAEELLKYKEEPPVFVSANLDGGDQINEKYYQKYTRLY